MLQARFVDRVAVDHRIRAREVDVLEDARVERRIVRALARVEAAGLVDEDRLARRDVAQHREAERLERDRFRGDEVLGPAHRLRSRR